MNLEIQAAIFNATASDSEMLKAQNEAHVACGFDPITVDDLPAIRVAARAKLDREQWGIRAYSIIAPVSRWVPGAVLLSEDPAAAQRGSDALRAMLNID